MTQFSYGVILQVLTLCSPKKTTQKFLCGNIFLSVNPNYDLTEDDGTVGHIKRCDRELSPEVTDEIDKAEYAAVYQCFAETIIPHLFPDDLPLVVSSLSYIVAHADNIGEEFPICAKDQRTKAFYLHPGEVEPAEFLTDLFFFSVKAVKNKDGEDFVKKIDTKDKLSLFSIDKENFSIRIPVQSYNPILERTIQSRNFEQAFEEVFAATMTLPNENEMRIFRLRSEDYEFSDARLKKFLTDNIGRYMFSRSRIEQFYKDKDWESIGIEAAQYWREHLSGNEFGEIMVYSFLEEILDAPKLFSRVELTGDLGLSDGIHLRKTNGQIEFQLVYGASDVRGDLRGAVDAALDRVRAIKDSKPTPYQIVNSASYPQCVPSNEAASVIKHILIPEKKGVEPPATAFGLFVGYTLNMSDDDLLLPLADYKQKMADRLKTDILTYAGYIKEKLVSMRLHQHSFFIYILPLNDADKDKHGIISKLIGGAV